ncbi:DUF6680 family protein [Flavobacterium sp. 2]|uniref:DUF6680 family protein n=1 Tax=Flavobacterium sp. 2 TaxID=308053 RepID=UPI003CE9EEC2
MSAKDYFEITYWLISLLILGFTIYYIKTSPIKAVETGRKLNDEQNKYNAKSELFLTLFSLRGNPTNYNFVNGLNQIDIVFEDVPAVLEAWERLYNSLNTKDQVNPIQEWSLLRTELLSEMAQSLGYQKLKQTAIQRNYSPQAHANQDDENWSFNQAAKKFFETGTILYNMHIESLELMNENKKANPDNNQ